MNCLHTQRQALGHRLRTHQRVRPPARPRAASVNKEAAVQAAVEVLASQKISGDGGSDALASLQESAVVDTALPSPSSPSSPSLASSTPAATAAFSSPIAHPAVFVSGLVLYSVVAVDVFHPDSAHLLQPLDSGLHEWVLSNLDPGLRRALFGTVLSNGWLLAATIGWIFTTATAMTRNNPLGWQACALGWLLWVHFVGPVEHDPTLMDMLKQSFGRLRPSPIHRTASFPSGHTAADVMTVGALLFVLLPVVYGSRQQQQGQQQQEGQQQEQGEQGQGQGQRQAAGSSGSSSGGAVAGFAQAVKDKIYAAQEHAGPLLAASAATTVVGRVGADAHWLSDTLAGGGLSLALVSGLAMATAQLAQRQQQQEQGQQGQQGQGQEGQQGQ
ncbi:hypothetical protein CHLRE_07g327100v5 [Chlamydomonas reinhardtii]|uniref:Phosphatidic acid phosphatase type 2/haloperoxidase domain-containing protein n=1 Tax=Chlamydomonas reinhardtii TaxID=3055 RepID=A0A2K3DJK6_CHLRE|nr:uncharacterized protein CHLRE_07g327100v5 [Chlamydomonas reinhardtii]PNW80719.1 hypothetical protein CHLRE_07g327100v5 [Chlamydomonas reinhardtii]